MPLSDSSLPLQEIRIKAFEQNRQLKDAAAAVNYIGLQTLNRFGNTSLVAAVNSTPGIRMEERSPGSYRLNIRGSSLRSPFGVRNVKIYFNDLPLTDPGGQTYLNSLGFYNAASIEILKGPGSSLYGAGTGGVMFIQSLPSALPSQVSASYTSGSYRLRQVAAGVQTQTQEAATQLSYQHLQSGGYRDHSALQRNVFSWTGRYSIDDNKTIKPTVLYSRLFYETPGALTDAEYRANDRQARPGSVANNASIRQSGFLAGFSYQQTFTGTLSNTTALYSAFNELQNPNLRGYDKAAEPHFGGRTVFNFPKALKRATIILTSGAELQYEAGKTSSYKNTGGTPDSIRYTDDVQLSQRSIFLQGVLDYGSWSFSAGASYNKTALRFQRFSPAASGEQSRDFTNNLIPRFSLSKSFAVFTLYSSISNGFSPPTTAELLPTGGAINLQLSAERGTNYDLGIRGAVSHQLHFDINAFIFSLDETITQRRDAAGGDYYTNSGSTKQRGVETALSYDVLFKNPDYSGTIRISHTAHNFHYKNFRQQTDDYSGRRLPGTAPHTLAAGFDFYFNRVATLHFNYFYSDAIPLNDANTAYANAYHLLGLKADYNVKVKTAALKIFAGVDNLLNQHYTAGADINGFGGRYYNAAPARSYYAGLSFDLAYKKKQIINERS